MNIGINGFGRIGRLVFRALFERAGISLRHVNDPAGDAATAAHLLAFDSVHGRWHHPVKAGGIRFPGGRSAGGLFPGEGSHRRALGRAPGWIWCSNAAASSRPPKPSSPTSASWRLKRVIVACPGEGRGGWRGSLERGVRHQPSPVRPGPPSPAHRRLLHHQLPGSGGEGGARKLRHPPRLDHHPPRRHQHPGGGGWLQGRSAPGPLLPDEPDPHHHRIGQGDRADLSRAGGQAQRPCRAGAPAQRFPHRRGVRAGAGGERRAGECRLRGSRQRVAAGNPGLRNPAPGVDRLRQRFPQRHHRRPLHPGGERQPAEGLRLVRQRMGLQLPHGGSGLPRGRPGAQ